MGVISSKSNNEVILIDSAQGGKEVRLQADQIVKEEGLPSLMPAGLADLLENRQEFLDLTKFLSVLGQPGDFANNESPVIRKWQLLTKRQVCPPNLGDRGASPTTPPLGKPPTPKSTANSPPPPSQPETAIYARAAVNVLTPGFNHHPPTQQPHRPPPLAQQHRNQRPHRPPHPKKRPPHLPPPHH